MSLVFTAVSNICTCGVQQKEYLQIFAIDCEKENSEFDRPRLGPLIAEKSKDGEVASSVITD